MSEFELLAEELLMSDSIIRVFGALRMSVKMFLMWNSSLLIDGGGDENVETSLLEASILIVLKESPLIHSNANLGVHGQGLLNLSGSGDCIEAQHLVLSLFYSVNPPEIPDFDFIGENSKLAFLFGSDDHWGPLHLYEEIYEKVPDATLAIEREGHTRAFSCIDAGSMWVAQQVCSLIKNHLLK